ncbi:DUF563 domain-containing protein [Hymenobacter sp. HMF4947]|uniref:DUF563 domain-containing protein n=1 Tax=Hymenobacter ginkgonis TaxID=2682976 RepID=A0A7K1T9Q8_9BACT|nr:glycosyltransferase family 61 protein [Hymenobacter ginkgonis]MVN75133.1 DUF563 domain-containing protein [Hymenobacter ginkgonis]
MKKTKKLLKKLFPVVLLNKAHLHYNKLRINTFDKVLFPEHALLKKDYILQRDAYPFNGTTIDTRQLDHRLQHQIEIWQNWTQDEYLLIYNQPCIIEPRAGWALTASNKLIYASLGFSRVAYLRKPAIAALRMRNSSIEEYTELISLRDTGEENYYHFYNDLLAKLFFLEDKLHLAKDIPILIAAALYKKPFFQYFLQHPYLRDRTWIVQDKQYVRSYKTYFCKPLTHTAPYYERVRLLALPQDIASTTLERRIFITRSPKRLRFIENGAEIEQLCLDAGFEVVDFDTISIAEQIQTLASSRYVIGIHGAGLVNMLFRGNKPMGLLEIFPPGEYYAFHYMLLAAQLNYTYDGMIGEISKNRFSGSFFVSPEELNQRIQHLLKN